MSCDASSIFSQIIIVMVHTENAGNIGSVARAMKTMGLTELVLVSPKRYPDPFAEWMASGAQDILSRAKVVDSLDEAIAECHFVVATSARMRRIPWPLVEAEKGVEIIVQEAMQSRRVAILMGPESQGLSNEDLQRCHIHLSIPANTEYPVLNVAMAVQIICYELRKAALLVEKQKSSVEPSIAGLSLPILNVQWDAPLATQEEFEDFVRHYEQVLVEIGFLDPQNPRQLMARSRRFFSRARMDKQELNMLRGVLTQVQLAHKNSIIVIFCV
jgi:tRNA (cytidine32/uridine32-2'-O)-methyltransferase